MSDIVDPESRSVRELRGYDVWAFCFLRLFSSGQGARSREMGRAFIQSVQYLSLEKQSLFLWLIQGCGQKAHPVI